VLTSGIWNIYLSICVGPKITVYGKKALEHQDLDKEICFFKPEKNTKIELS